MAALNIAHELLQLKTATPGSSMVPENTLESPAIARRIEAIERKLDASLAEYDAVP
jgi:cell division protein ZapA (FtsZ GTPase activity inhibitor)